MNKPVDGFKYVSDYIYNRHNYDNQYVLEEDDDWWYVNEQIPRVFGIMKDMN